MAAPSKKAASAMDGMSKLTIDSAKASNKPPKTKKKVVADSWEDEDVSSEDDAEASKTPTIGAPEGTTAPPPTPISPNYNNTPLHYSPLGEPIPNPTGDAPRVRPQTTDAVARRMIAAGLGVKAPKATEEQKAYDRSVREQERRKKEEERAKDKAKAEETERAKKAIWED